MAWIQAERLRRLAWSIYVSSPNIVGRVCVWIWGADNFHAVVSRYSMHQLRITETAGRTCPWPR